MSKAFELPIPASVVKAMGNGKFLVSAQLSSQEHHLYLDDEKDRSKLLKKLKS